MEALETALEVTLILEYSLNFQVMRQSTLIFSSIQIFSNTERVAICQFRAANVRLKQDVHFLGSISEALEWNGFAIFLPPTKILSIGAESLSHLDATEQPS